MQEVGLPAGRHRCRCPAPCDLVPGCSSYRSEPRFLGVWQGESEEAAHHTTPPKQGEHSANPPSPQTLTVLGELLALRYPPTHHDT